MHVLSGFSFCLPVRRWLFLVVFSIATCIFWRYVLCGDRDVHDRSQKRAGSNHRA